MPTCFNKNSMKIAHVEATLYKDFLAQIILHDEPVQSALMMYKAQDREKLETYIKHRLAEVDPGYVP